MEWLIPLGIFIARIGDVTIGTVRIIMIARERRVAAMVLGFFEVLIWLAAIGAVMAHLHQWQNFLAFAGGYAVGNFLGVSIQSWMALGDIGVRVITGKDASNLVNGLRSLGYGVTMVPAHGASGPVSVCYLIAHRRDLPQVISVVHAFNPKAFYTLEDIRYVSSGVMPAPIKGEMLQRLLMRRRQQYPQAAAEPGPELPSAMPLPGSSELPNTGPEK